MDTASFDSQPVPTDKMCLDSREETLMPYHKERSKQSVASFSLSQLPTLENLLDYEMEK